MKCLEHPRFVAGDVDTGFIAAEEADLEASPISSEALQGAARILRFGDGVAGRDPFSPWEHWNEASGLRLNAPPVSRQTVFVNGVRAVIEIDQDVGAHHQHFEPVQGTTVYFEDGSPFEVSALSPRGAAAGTASDGSLRAPMPGKIVATPAKAGDTVSKGQPVVVLEAMKMEHALVAPFDGVVGELSVAVGDQVAADAVLAVVTTGAD
jgi:acetyl/propionyl-CoA carboxylase alpha subunit